MDPLIKSQLLYQLSYVPIVPFRWRPSNSAFRTLQEDFFEFSEFAVLFMIRIEKAKDTIKLL